jgi:molybdenum ABC transporter molybdate-binding protein
MSHLRRRGHVNQFTFVVSATVGLLAILTGMLWYLGRSGLQQPQSNAPDSHPTSSDAQSDGTKRTAEPLLLYCAAGMRVPVEQAVAAYEREYGVPVHVQYGGSNTLLSQIEVARTGDLFLAADDSYSRLAQQKGLTQELLPLAVTRPVIAVKRGNSKQIRSIDDLMRDDVSVALGSPDQAAIGQITRTLLEASGRWQRLHDHVTRTGVFKPTVPDVANDIKLGSVDAGIIWDTTVAQYPELEAVRTPELDQGEAHVSINVMTESRIPSAALRFARYLTASDKGLPYFADSGFQVVDGDEWQEVPQLTFFCGSVNRRAVDAVIKAFEIREGVRVNTIYNGCGILTAQMRTIHEQQQAGGFPDTYMACDRFYLDSVSDWFQEDVDVSDTEVVIAVPKGNPKNIQTLQDLTKAGLRISVGQPDQCTIGVLTRKVLEDAGVYDAVMRNVVTQTPSSAMLIPTVTTRSVDATLAYATDTKAESDKVDAIRIDSPAAKAIQPFAIARSSRHKYLGRRLYQSLAKSRVDFENAGFHFRLDEANSGDPNKAPAR